ncbi:glycine--tRNA ligase subunit beta [Geomicrobium sp. JCM 19039]|uniref:glycine--tRNA ligase subunit beta n=1 Tax=Geomicrobium sp. JCM 19039 TaxID=1460636 RepID=UPI00045F2CF5|nr:glycine--tRNA ligase subunit beta [Geomicrobium sp. JCM 19039]GAK11473.1 glycyl-tRNA synthetase beta chain [Geomicrobium sp. JCM 19039]
MAKTLLLELGLEEIPAQFVDIGRDSFEQKVTQWFKDKRVNYSSIKAFSTPRRFGVLVFDVDEVQPDTVEESRGPSASIAKNEDGSWSKAAIGFAKGKGLDADQLETRDTEQGSYVYAVKKVTGQKTIHLLPEVVQLYLDVSFPKSMRWGHSKTRYVRPIHWVCALFGDEVIPATITNIQTGRNTYGHRFLGTEVELEQADDYEETLLREFVLVMPEKRQAAIKQQIALLEEEHGWTIDQPAELLQEVTNLVEYPTALHGDFDENFLQLPDPVLITSMREHQRYFAVHSETGELLPHFVTVRNGDHLHLDNIKRGNEKVLRARLSDAVFFYNEDQKLSVDELLKRLDSIVEQEKVGTLKDKSVRTAALALLLAEALGVSDKDRAFLERATELLKVDQSTLMVDEFPELEGLIGSDYLARRGEHEMVVSAVKDHYSPRFNGDRLPDSKIGAYASIADKLDTITSAIAIGQKPSGSQDPYGLRRQAAAVVTLANHFALNITFEQMVELAVGVAEKAPYTIENPHLQKDIEEFFLLRMKTALEEADVRYDIVESLLVLPLGRVDTVFQKASFLQSIHGTEELKQAAEALGRVNNIAKQDEQLLLDVSPSLFVKAEEHDLYKAYEALRENMGPMLDHNDVDGAWQQLVQLSPVIHRYFDEIMVMSKEEHEKNNRLAQMRLLSVEINRFAKFQSLVLPS